MTNNKLTLPVLLTVAVLVAGVFVMGTTFEDAEAAKPNPKVKPFKCSSSGIFDNDAGTITATGVGNCSHMGKTTSLGTFVVTGGVIVDDVDCVTVESTNSVLTAANGDTVKMSLITGTQCFFNEDGDPIDATPNFCGDSANAHTSTVDGTYKITDGDGRFTKADGSGDVFSNANHCLADTFESTLSGTIEYAASNKS